MKATWSLVAPESAALLESLQAEMDYLRGYKSASKRTLDEHIMGRCWGVTGLLGINGRDGPMLSN